MQEMQKKVKACPALFSSETCNKTFKTKLQLSNYCYICIMRVSLVLVTLAFEMHR